MAAAARSSGRIARRVPLKAFPTAVRTELTITASRMACLPLHLLDATHWMPQGRKNQPQVDSRPAPPQTGPLRSDGDAEDTKGTRDLGRHPPPPPPFMLVVFSKDFKGQKSVNAHFTGN